MSTDLTNYYTTIQQIGHLRTPEHAQRWSAAILKTLGLSLDRKTQKKLAKALPEPLSTEASRFIWILHFRDKTKTRQEFQDEVARRSGNSDPTFAQHPIQGAFHGLKQIIDNDTRQAIANSLAPEISKMWQDA
jgi:uncharacterized protein (DUF2267 family)